MCYHTDLVFSQFCSITNYKLGLSVLNKVYLVTICVQLNGFLLLIVFIFTHCYTLVHQG